MGYPWIKFILVMDAETVTLNYHIWIISGLVVAIVSMAIYIVRSNNKYEKIAKESNIVVSRNSVVIENNTKSHDRIYESLVNVNGKKRR